MKDEQEAADFAHQAVANYVKALSEVGTAMEEVWYNLPWKERHAIYRTYKWVGQGPTDVLLQLAIRDSVYGFYTGDEEGLDAIVNQDAEEIMVWLIKHNADLPWFQQGIEGDSLPIKTRGMVHKLYNKMYRALKKLFKSDPKLKEVLLSVRPEQSGDEAGGAGEGGDSAPEPEGGGTAATTDSGGATAPEGSGGEDPFANTPSIVR